MIFSNTKRMEIIKSVLDIIIYGHPKLFNNLNEITCIDNINDMENTLFKALNLVDFLNSNNMIVLIQELLSEFNYTLDNKILYSNNLLNGKIDSKCINNEIFRYGRISSSTFKTKVKRKSYETEFNLYLNYAINYILENIKSIMSSMSMYGYGTSFLYEEIKEHYYNIYQSWNNSILKLLNTQNEDIDSIEQLLKININNYSKQWCLFFKTFISFKNKQNKNSFLKEDYTEKDELFYEYVCLKSLIIYFEENKYEALYKGNIRNKETPLCVYKKDDTLIEIYYQNTMALKTSRYKAFKHTKDEIVYTRKLKGIPDFIIKIKSSNNIADDRFVLLDSKCKSKFDNSTDRHKMIGYLNNFNIKKGLAILLYYKDIRDDTSMSYLIEDNDDLSISNITFDKTNLSVNSLYLSDINNLSEHIVFKRILNSIIG